LEDNFNVCIIGMGYVGLTLAVVLAERGYKVAGIEINNSLLLNLQKGIPHFHEEGLAIRLKNQLKLKI
jgi:UDP-glucose 6-dehydrogenase